MITCGRRIANYYLKNATWTVLFLNATFPTLLCHEGSAGTPRTSIDHDRQTPGTRWRKGCCR
jgi:hypothetical protein